MVDLVNQCKMDLFLTIVPFNWNTKEDYGIWLFLWRSEEYVFTYSVFLCSLFTFNSLSGLLTEHEKFLRF